MWGVDAKPHTHSLHVYIGQLRREIEKDPAHPRLLHTLHGVGYRFGDEYGNARQSISQ
jgi:two-component system KDP operon response regulator KdpE